MFKPLTFLLLAVATAVGAWTPNIIVGKNGTGAYDTIQAAINSIPTNNSAEKIILIKAVSRLGLRRWALGFFFFTDPLILPPNWGLPAYPRALTASR